MKLVFKNPVAPRELSTFERDDPKATWENLRNFENVYAGIRDQIINDQYGLCAYCECKISGSEPLTTRVEHFHPKSDATDPLINWALLWSNMIGVCNGGDKPYLHERNPPYPLPENLSCDSHKNHMEQMGKISKDCEGFILNPLTIIASPCLFWFNPKNGFLEPNAQHCETIQLESNKFSSVFELVENTIKILNLNCDRLVQQRLVVFRNIEHNKKEWRNANRDVTLNLISRYLDHQWRPFFTTIRLCLGQVAEQYLKNLDFRG